MKKVLFLSGTRADYGKLKPLIREVERCGPFESHIFVTGMHMLRKYGMTASEVKKTGHANIHTYINQNVNDSMDTVLAKTIHGLSDFVKELNPDLIVVHGDRVEAMAGALVGSLNNILVAHIEGGEVSGTIDEMIRHSVSKMAHIHFVSNDIARRRLLQLGELESCIHVIGSPDLDVLLSSDLPSLPEVKERYDIPFKKYSILMYHPVTTEISTLNLNISHIVESVKFSGLNFVVIYPNNDLGTEHILNQYQQLEGDERIKIFPSLRFEYFLTLLKYASSIVGNSSAGVREAPYFGTPAVNIGSRQANRSSLESIVNLPEMESLLVRVLQDSVKSRFPCHNEFGSGNSADLFLKIICEDSFWATSPQKYFVDMDKET